ncbi:hypothetical protein GGI35DRAFT_305040 [Trichoderma velutinum]
MPETRRAQQGPLVSLLLLVHRVQLVTLWRVSAPLRLQPARGSVLPVYCSSCIEVPSARKLFPLPGLAKPQAANQGPTASRADGGARNRKINRRYRVGVLQVPPQVSSPVPRWYRALRLRWLHFGWRCRGEGGVLAMSRLLLHSHFAVGKKEWRTLGRPVCRPFALLGRRAARSITKTSSCCR